jgi:hypothetical protein
MPLPFLLMVTSCVVSKQPHQQNATGHDKKRNISFHDFCINFCQLLKIKDQAIIFTTISFNKEASVAPELFIPMLLRL